MLTSVDHDRPVLDDLPYWLALNQRDYYFPAHLVEKSLGSISLRDFWEAPESVLASLSFDKRSIKELDKIRSDRTLDECEKLRNILDYNKIKVIKFTDSEYPQQLRKIVNPPLLLFMKGTQNEFNRCAAIVGTRNATFHGRTMARKLAKRLADEEFVIVSGLARGIDEEAHCGALESKNGKTLAVLAWFEPIYPDEHSQLVREIELRGARISQNYGKTFGSMTPAKFVERNRITSGLSRFVIIVETGDDGGTIRQAELARQQGKPIFVFCPRENERAYGGFNIVVEKHGGIPFKDVDELMNNISDKRFSSENKLTQFSLDPQMRLGE